MSRIVHAFDVISPFETADWDERIARYATKCLFHERAWLRFLEHSQGARTRALRLVDERGEVVGYFCGAEVRKGFFKLLGSPLQGWTTNAMGPIVEDCDPVSLLRAVEAYCRSERIDYLEMCHPSLPDEVMAQAGYELDADATYVVRVDEETAMWERMDSKGCRYAIRRGMKNGLEVEHATDPEFVDEYYAQLQDVFLRQGLVPTYSKSRVKELWDALVPAGRLLALRVRHHGEAVATGLFPFDERSIYFWGGASWVKSYPLNPNELMQWHVMLFALSRKIPVYNMGGGGTFKRKFGGEPQAVQRWFKTLSPSARVGRAAFKGYVRARQRILGRWKRTFSARPPVPSQPVEEAR